MSGDLAGRTIAILGGDERVREIARPARAAGAAVRAQGAPPGIAEVLGGPQAPSVADAVAGADAIILPVPGFGPEDRIDAPRAPHPVALTAAAARGWRPGAPLLSGKVPPTRRAVAAAAGLRPHTLNGDDEPAGLHAMATAEGPRASPSRTRRAPSMGRRSWPLASARPAPRTDGRDERHAIVRILRTGGIARGSEA